MGRWRIRGFIIAKLVADHAPRHVHVLKGGREIGRYDLENRRWMKGSKHGKGRAQKAVQEWIRRHGA